MADPLSIAGGVVGLVAAGAQITKMLTQVIKKARDAPDECRRIITQVDDIRNVLVQLQTFVIGTSRPSRSRTSLILVDQVIVTLAACVTTFSELDALTKTLESEAGMGVLDRIRWLIRDKELKDIIQRLESHKSSLILMMTILTWFVGRFLYPPVTSARDSALTLRSQKQDDAEEKVDKLCDLVQQSLERYAFLGQRLAALELGAVGYEPKPPSIPDVPAGKIPEVNAQVRTFAFEEVLMTSRAYRGMTFDSSDTLSMLSSAGRTASWSMLSGLSLSEISRIAILAIPIYPSDLSNEHVYDFEPSSFDDLADAATPLILPAPDPREKTLAKRFLSKLIPVTRQKPSIPVTQAPELDPPSKMFGQSLQSSLQIANVVISVTGEDNETKIYGYIPIVVAKAGVFIKEAGTFEVIRRLAI